MKGMISLFDDNKNWLMAGMRTEDEKTGGRTHLEASHRSIDNWRRYSNRQIQGETYDILVETELGRDDDTIERLDANRTFEKLISTVVGQADLKEEQRTKMAKMVACLMRLHGVEDYLEEDNLKVVETLIGDFYPEHEYEIARFLGYSVNEVGTSTRFAVWKSWLGRECKLCGVSFA